MIFKKASFGIVLAGLAVVAMTASADAQAPKPKPRPLNSVNSSYMAGPHTRVYVTRRSWLDMGTEVNPGDRKYTDYAFPPGQSTYYNAIPPYGSAGPRRPLNSPSDMGGFPLSFPIQ